MVLLTLTLHLSSAAETLSVGLSGAEGDRPLSSSGGAAPGGGAAGQVLGHQRWQTLSLWLLPAGVRAGCRRLLPVQTFLCSSSARAAHRCLRLPPRPARRPGAPRGSAVDRAALCRGPTLPVLVPSLAPRADGGSEQEHRDVPGPASGPGGSGSGGCGPRAPGSWPTRACPALASRGPESPWPLPERPVVGLEPGPPAQSPHLRFR